MKKIKDFDFKGKKVIVRCDFNVPLSEKGEIVDDFRIKAALPTLNYLIKQGAKIILITHLETKTGNSTLKPVAERVEKLLSKKIVLFTDYLEENAKEKIDELLRKNSIVMLENVRFHEGEKKNDPVFAEKLAKLGDIFVNEAFAVSHRAHASVALLPEYLPKTAGFLLEKEVEVLSELLEKPKRPFVAIIGGIKIETKIKTILNILKVADHLIIGSKIGEVILAQKGLIVGRPYKEEQLLKSIKLTNKKLHLPIDGAIALKDFKESYLRKGGIGTLRAEEDVFDIGPESIKVFKEIINTAKTILWNGPLGMYEDKRFAQGTKEIGDSITRNHTAFKIAGGGETVSAINYFGFSGRFDFLSTGGGAMLEFLAGEKLPGIEALE